MKRKIIILSSITLAGLALVSIGILVLLHNPNLMLRPKVVRTGLKHALGNQANVTWNTFNSSIQSHGLMDHTLFLEFSQLCMDQKPHIPVLCFQEARIQLHYKIDRFRFHLIELGPLDLLGGNVMISLKQDNLSKKSSPLKELPIFRGTIPAWMQKTKFQASQLSVDSLTILNDDTQYHGNFRFYVTTDPQKKLHAINLQSEIIAPESMHLNFDASLQSPSNFHQSDWDLFTKTKIKMSQNTHHSLTFQFNKSDDTKILFQGDSNYTQKTLQSRFEISGRMEPRQVQVDFSGHIQNIHPIIPKTLFNHCRFTHTKKSIQNRATSTLHCPMLTTLSAYRLPKEFQGIYELPEQLQLDLHADIDGFFVPDKKEEIQINSKMDLYPVKQSFLTTYGNISGLSKGGMEIPFQDWNHESNLVLNFQINEFSELVHALKQSNYAVPAPFNVFKGAISFKTQGSIATYRKMNHLPFKLTTRLKSKEQKLDVEGEGEFQVQATQDQIKITGLHTNLILNDVHLQLPTVDVTNLPRLTPDERVKSTQTKSKFSKNEDLNYRVHFKTTKKPVQLDWNVASNTIPVELDVEFTPGQINGTTQSEGAILELFRRQAEVEHSEITWKNPIELSPIRGRLKVSYTDYTVWIHMSGTIKKPVIRFESEPALSHDDIIAVLIYGEPLTQLDEEKVSNVGGISNAVSDRVLALTSLYVLASTPIQRVNYDPQTKVFSAKVKITQGTSLTIGSDGADQNYVGLRRRLGKGWFISTTIENGPNENNPKGSAFIEWHKRY